MELSSVHGSLGIPRTQPAGDIFNGRIRLRPQAPDAALLTSQINEAKLRRIAEREEGRQVHRVAGEADRKWLDHLREEREAQKWKSEKLRDNYKEQMQLKREEHRHYKAGMSKTGSVLFSESEGAAEDVAERQDLRHRNKQFSDENLAIIREHIQQKCTDQELFEVEKKEASDERQYQGSVKRLVLEQRQVKKKALADFLGKQIQENKERKRKEVDDRREWRETNFLTNESSDEEN